MSQFDKNEFLELGKKAEDVYSQFNQMKDKNMTKDTDRMLIITGSTNNVLSSKVTSAYLKYATQKAMILSKHNMYTACVITRKYDVKVAKDFLDEAQKLFQYYKEFHDLV